MVYNSGILPYPYTESIPQGAGEHEDGCRCPEECTCAGPFGDLDRREGGRQYLLDITADDYYKLYVNGHFAGQGPAPAYPEQYYYNIIDITSWLQEGKNVLAVHLYYQGLVNRVWNSGDGRFAMAARLGQGCLRQRRYRKKKAGKAGYLWYGGIRSVTLIQEIR